MTDITPIFQAVISVVAFAITAVVIPWLSKKIGAAKTNELLSWVKIFVEAAEQIYRESGMGEKKKAYVLNRLQEKGYDLDLEAIDDMIEAAVLELNMEAGAKKGSDEK